MGVKVWKNEQGQVMVQGIPAGFWVFIIFGILFYIVGWPVLLAGSFVAGTILITIGTIFLFSGKVYGNSRRQKKVNEYYRELKAVERQSKEIISDEEWKEFEEFKKWRNSRNDDDDQK